MAKHLYVGEAGSGALDIDLSALTERHRIKIEIPVLAPGGTASVDHRQAGIDGVIVEIPRGCAVRAELSLASDLIRRGTPTFFYWPREGAIERMDKGRVKSHRNLRLALDSWSRLTGAPKALTGGPEAADCMGDRFVPRPVAVWPHKYPSPEAPLEGLGVYLRLDYWNQFHSGGSYGHTVHVMRELARRSQDLRAIVNQIYDLPGRENIHQVEVPREGLGSRTLDVIEANDRLYRAFRGDIERLKPAFIYERLVPGSWLGARLSAELQIPYLVEYNGSESAMRKSFGGQRDLFEPELIRMERLAFDQATLISVVSRHVKDDLLERGVAGDRILVNPNGADPALYRPGTEAERAAIRTELGLPGDSVVVGFSGTFGAWHGVDLLAESLPRILSSDPRVRFLLIGDGNFKHLIDAAVEKHKLADRVIRTGSVAQRDGARYLQACDILVSPHNRHMADSPFFGSPTKVFEYMAMGAGIVASDLEQIGEVLRPALTPAQAAQGSEPAAARAVLCRPGDLEEFVSAVTALVRNSSLTAALGANARAAVIEHYSWSEHVDRLFKALSRQSAPTPSPQAEAHPSTGVLPILQQDDADKVETQKQWNADACGSQYAEGEPKTLDWYLDVERYRYQDYAPWMHETMEFARHKGHSVLEICAGMGTDHAQFAKNGAQVTDIDLSLGHLEHAQRNFKLRGLTGRFVHQDAEKLPFETGEFDIVYSNGVIHHTPNTRDLVAEIFRVLKPGGRAIIMVYAENSWHYWTGLVYSIGLVHRMLGYFSMGEIMSRTVERSDASGARPLVKVYTKERLRGLFPQFEIETVVQRQLTPTRWMQRIPGLAALIEKTAGWNLVIKAKKPGNS